MLTCFFCCGGEVAHDHHKKEADTKRVSLFFLRREKSMKNLYTLRVL